MPRSATRSEWGSWDASDLDGVEVGDFRAEIACPNDGVLLELGNEDPVGDGAARLREFHRALPDGYGLARARDRKDRAIGLCRIDDPLQVRVARLYGTHLQVRPHRVRRATLSSREVSRTQHFDIYLGAGWISESHRPVGCELDEVGLHHARKLETWQRSGLVADERQLDEGEVRLAGSDGDVGEPQAPALVPADLVAGDVDPTDAGLLLLELERDTLVGREREVGHFRGSDRAGHEHRVRAEAAHERLQSRRQGDAGRRARHDHPKQLADPGLEPRAPELDPEHIADPARPARDANDRAGLVVLGEVDAGPVDRRGVIGGADVNGAGREARLRTDDRRGSGERLCDDLREVLEEPCRRGGAVEDLVVLGVAEVVAELVERDEVALTESEGDLVDA